MIHARGLMKTYVVGGETVHALAGVDLDIAAGEMTAITGTSGSGKSTLMNVLGLLDRVDAGTYHLDGRNVAGLSGDALAAERGRRIGFVFQSFHLLARLDVIENVALPLRYARDSQARDKAVAALNRVGLGDRLGHRPNQLSGGQRQRVAIARALVIEPAILLADEPTGNLDTRTGQEVLTLFDTLHQEGRTILIVTHDPAVAARCHRRIHLVDGRVAADERSP
jgi:putative ABC transport system ATP-binding protein